MSRRIEQHFLHFTSPVWSDEEAPVGTPTPELTLQLGLSSEMPFFLSESGEYPAELNAFLRSLPTDGRHSSATWEAYGRDIDSLIRYLRNVKQVDWLDAGPRDLSAYRLVRRGPDAQRYGTKLAARSWNRALAAIEGLYSYAVEEGHLQKSPLRYRTSVKSNGGRTQGSRKSKLRDPEHGSEEVRCISLEQYRIFRDVGLRGRLPDGTVDDTFKGAHTTRNVLFADFLVETGLRVTEAAGLLQWEVPKACAGEDARKSVKVRLPTALAKGRKSRSIRLQMRLLWRIREYVEIERANVACDLHVDARNGVTPVRKVSLTHYVDEVTGLRQKISEAPISDRRRFVQNKGSEASSVALWLGERGRMMTQDWWRGVFKNASARCTALGYPMEVTPHTLRHTFAVHILQRLIDGMLSPEVAQDVSRDSGMAKYRRMMGDPLRTLQRMLGHTSITSTYIYLTLLDQVVEILDVALDDWNQDLSNERRAAQ